MSDGEGARRDGEAGRRPRGQEQAELRVPEPVDLGGDPACWLDRVCAECGRFVDDPLADQCPVCGAPR